MKVNRFTTAVIVAVVLSLVFVGCSDDGDEGSTSATAIEGSAGAGAGPGIEPGSGIETATTGPTLSLAEADALAAATTYADVVHRSYSDAVTGAEEMRVSIQALVTTPSEATLAAARQTWVNARHVYGPTEAFRFYDGPIDHPETGLERRINGWPIDESYIDHTTGTSASGIVNDLAGFPEITIEAIIAANGQGDQPEVSTGWHAIEFLLWGHDTSVDGPGARPATDFDSAANADRRGVYLRGLAEVLVGDLVSIRDQWSPEGGAYRAAFLAEPVLAVQKILRGMGALAAGELAGKRLAVAYESGEEGDELARFSDNTHNDIVANAQGVRTAYLADHPGVEGTSLSDVVARLAPDVDADLRKQLDNNVAAAQALPGPFDQLIAQDDDSPDRAELSELIEDFRAQGDAIADLAAALGLEISLEI